MSSLKLLDDKVACSLPGRIKQEIRKTEPRGYARLLKLAKHVAGKVWPRKQVICFFFFFGRVGSSLLRAGFLQLRRAGAALPCGAWASQSGGFGGSVVVARGLSRSVACGILPDQGSNPCPLLWQADS